MAVGERRLEVGPDQLVGIEFRRVTGEPFHLQPGTACAQGLHVRPLVNTPAVEQHDDVTTKMTQQGAQEDRHFDVADVRVGMKVKVEAHAVPLRAHRDRRDRGDLVASIPVPDDGGLTAGRPGPSDIGDQEEAALVGEDQMGLQALRVFFIVVQRYRFQRAIAASSRSSARRSGFWHDQPSAVSRRPT